MTDTVTIVEGDTTTIVNVGYSLPESGSLPTSGGTMLGTLVLAGSPAMQIPGGAASGDVLVSDASGNASWSTLTTIGLATNTALAAETTRAEAAEAAETARAEAAEAAKLPLAGGTLTGELILDGSSPAMRIPAGASAGYVLTSDGSGNGTWAAAAANVPLVPTAVKTGAYSANPSDFIPASIASGSFTVTLPSAPADKTTIGVKLIGTNATATNALTVSTSGSDVFNVAGGSTTSTLTLLYQGEVYQYSAAPKIWYRVDNDLPLSGLKNLFPAWLNVKAYGATGNGTTDDTAAVQATINAAIAASYTYSGPNGTTISASAVVYFPTGQYLCNEGPLNWAASSNSVGLRFTGDAATLITTSNGLFDMQTKGLQNWELDHLGFNVTGGHIITNVSLKFSSIHDCEFFQQSAGYSVLTMGTTGTGMQGCRMYDCLISVLPDPTLNTRSVPAMNIILDASASFSSNRFERLDCFNLRNAAGYPDNTQWFFDIQSTDASGGHMDQNTIRDCLFERVLGGAIRGLSVATLTMDRISIQNVFEQPSGDGFVISNSLIYIGTAAGNPDYSTGCRVSNYTREGGGVTVGSGNPSDIECSSDTVGLLIDSIDEATNPSETMQVNLHDAAGVTIINPPSTLTIQNQGAGTIVVGNGVISTATSTSNGAASLTPTFANGTASRLSDLTRDYMVYLQVGTPGTAFSVLIGPTSTPANTVFASATPSAGDSLSFRLPAAWYVKWAGTSSTLANQLAISC